MFNFHLTHRLFEPSIPTPVEKKNFFLKQDWKRAVRFFEIASKKGSYEGKWRIGQCKFLGRGTNQNTEVGIAILRKTSKKNSLPGLLFFSQTFSCFSIAEVQILKRLSQQKYPQGLWLFGWRLLCGHGIQKNETEGRKLLLTAAEIGWKSHAKWIAYHIQYGDYNFIKSPDEANRYRVMLKNRTKFEEEFFLSTFQ